MSAVQAQDLVVRAADSRGRGERGPDAARLAGQGRRPPLRGVPALEAPRERVRAVPRLGRPARGHGRGLPHLPALALPRRRGPDGAGGARRRHGDRPGVPRHGHLSHPHAARGGRPDARGRGDRLQHAQRPEPAGLPEDGLEPGPPAAGRRPPVRPEGAGQDAHLTRPCGPLVTGDRRGPGCRGGAGRRGRRRRRSSSTHHATASAPIAPRSTSPGGPRSARCAIGCCSPRTTTPPRVASCSACGAVGMPSRRRSWSSSCPTLAPARAWCAGCCPRPAPTTPSGCAPGRPHGLLPLPRQGPQLTTRPLAASAPSPSQWALTLGDVELF